MPEGHIIPVITNGQEAAEALTEYDSDLNRVRLDFMPGDNGYQVYVSLWQQDNAYLVPDYESWFESEFDSIDIGNGWNLLQGEVADGPTWGIAARVASTRDLNVMLWEQGYKYVADPDLPAMYANDVMTPRTGADERLWIVVRDEWLNTYVGDWLNPDEVQHTQLESVTLLLQMADIEGWYLNDANSPLRAVDWVGQNADVLQVRRLNSIHYYRATQGEDSLRGHYGGPLIIPEIGTSPYWPVMAMDFLRSFLGWYLAFAATRFSQESLNRPHQFVFMPAFSNMYQTSVPQGTRERQAIPWWPFRRFNPRDRDWPVQRRTERSQTLVAVLQGLFIGKPAPNEHVLIEVHECSPSDQGIGHSTLRYESGGLRTVGGQSFQGQSDGYSWHRGFHRIGGHERRWVRRFTIRVQCQQANDEQFSTGMRAVVAEAIETVLTYYPNLWHSRTTAPVIKRLGRGLSTYEKREMKTQIDLFLRKYAFEIAHCFGNDIVEEESVVQSETRDVRVIPTGSDNHSIYQIDFLQEYSTLRS